MFEKFKRWRAERAKQQADERRHDAVEQAEATYEHALAHWQEQRDEVAHLLEVAQEFPGVTDTDGFLLDKGEALFATINNCALVEDRKGKGHWEGRSSGFSIPIGSLGGHAIRYHTGATRGHYVQGAPVPTAVDQGTLYLTDQRAVFVGAKTTRECAFAKLVAYHHDDGATTLSVSNRKKATVVVYGAKIAGWVDFRFDLALAHYRGEVPEMVARLRQDLKRVEDSKPVAPTLPAQAPGDAGEARGNAGEAPRPV